MDLIDKKLKRIEELMGKKNIVGANSLADSLLKENDCNARLLSLSARIKLIMGKVDEAKRLAEIACLKHNRSIEARYVLGHCYQSMGDFEDAAEVYRYVIKRVPDSAFAHFQLGESLYKVNNREESLASYQRAAELDKEGDIRSIAETKILDMKENMGRRVDNAG